MRLRVLINGAYRVVNRLVFPGATVTITNTGGLETATVETTGEGASAAADVTVADAGNHFAGSNVEAVLAELPTFDA